MTAVAVLAPPALAVSSARPLLTAAVGVEANASVVLLQGEGDLSATPVLAEVLSKVIADGTGDVIVDLEGVAFIDIAALRTLAIAHRLLKRRSRAMTFRSPSRLTTRMLFLLGLFGSIDQSDSRGVTDPS